MPQQSVIFDEHFRIDIAHPGTLMNESLKEMQDLEVAAAIALLPQQNFFRTPDDVRYMFKVDDFETYAAEHRDPRVRWPHLDIKRPRVVRARLGSQLLAVGYVDDESSGHEIVRAIKVNDPFFMLWRVARLGSVSVDPDFWRQGVGSMVAVTGADTRHGRQPLATYFSDEHPFMRRVLHSAAFEFADQPDQRKSVRNGYYGDHRPPVEQYRAVQKTGRFVSRVAARHAHQVRALRQRGAIMNQLPDRSLTRLY